jgi:hypothetical protein
VATAQSQWASTSAQVTRAIDGEAIEVKIGDRAEIVRYIGISTPEIQLPTRGGERYGEAAKAANARLATGKNVQLVFDIQRRDRFGRLLAYVYAGDSFLRDAASGPTQTPRSIIGPGRRFRKHATADLFSSGRRGPPPSARGSIRALREPAARGGSRISALDGLRVSRSEGTADSER